MLRAKPSSLRVSCVQRILKETYTHGSRIIDIFLCMCFCNCSYHIMGKDMFRLGSAKWEQCCCEGGEKLRDPHSEKECNNEKGFSLRLDKHDCPAIWTIPNCENSSLALDHIVSTEAISMPCQPEILAWHNRLHDKAVQIHNRPEAFHAAWHIVSNKLFSIVVVGLKFLLGSCNSKGKSPCQP